MIGRFFCTYFSKWQYCPPQWMGEYGYFDDFSPEDFNILLFDNRAKSVANALIAKGVPQDRVVTKAYGEMKPKVPNTTPEGRSANRRVELKILF